VYVLDIKSWPILFFFFLNSLPPAQAAPNEETQKKIEEKKDIDLNAPVFIRPSHHLRLTPITFSLVRKNGVAGQLQIHGYLEVENDAIHAQLSNLRDIIYDAIIDRLWRVFSVLWTPGTVPNQVIIRRHMEKALKKVKHLPPVKAVHIEQIFIAVPRYGPYRVNQPHSSSN
jgi:hypothetical protein